MEPELGYHVPDRCWRKEHTTGHKKAHTITHDTLLKFIVSPIQDPFLFGIKNDGSGAGSKDDGKVGSLYQYINHHPQLVVFFFIFHFSFSANHSIYVMASRFVEHFDIDTPLPDTVFEQEPQSPTLSTASSSSSSSSSSSNAADHNKNLTVKLKRFIGTIRKKDSYQQQHRNLSAIFSWSVIIWRLLSSFSLYITSHSFFLFTHTHTSLCLLFTPYMLIIYQMDHYSRSNTFSLSLFAHIYIYIYTLCIECTIKFIK